MTDATATPPATTPPAGQAPKDQQQGQQQDEAEPRDWLSLAGTAITVITLAGVAVVLLDIALKGRVLGPLFARMRRPVPAEDEGGEDGQGSAPRAE